MRVRLFFVLVLLFALSCSSFAQVEHPLIEHPLIKNKADAPVQITEAFCGQNEHWNYCHATLQFADTKETWDGYGLLWIVTYEDGSKSPLYEAGDRSIEPTGRPDGSFQPSGRFYKPGEIVGKRKEGQATYGGARFGKTDKNGKTVLVTDAQVEIEFVINANGTVWGEYAPGSFYRYLFDLFS